MKQRIFAGCMTLLLLICTACQPTPEEEIVKNRGDKVLEQAVNATAAPTYAPEEAYEVPERWEETFDVRGQTVKVNTEINVADTCAYPIVTINQEEFAEKDAAAFFKTMLGEKTELREQVSSYSELLVELMKAERGRFTETDDGEVVCKPYKEQEQEIADLKEQLAQTNPVDIYAPLGNTFPMYEERAIKDENGKQWYGYVLNSGASFCDYKGLIQMESWIKDEGGYPGEVPHSLENVNISLEEAEEKAKEWIARLNEGTFSLAHYDKARILVDNGIEFSTQDEGYYLIFVRDIGGGVPLFYNYYSEPNFLNREKSETMYAADWQQEHLEIFVSETGVHFFSWSHKKNVVNTANENVQLMPFEEIQDSIRKLISYSLKDADNTVLITHMILSTSIQQAANQRDEAFMVPTWVLFVTTESAQKAFCAPCVLLINAIDGTPVW